MSDSANTVAMQPLDLLKARFEANCRALAARDETLAGQISDLSPRGRIMLHAAESQVALARQIEGRIEPIPCRLPPAAAQEVAGRMYPTGKVAEASLVAGIDQGWLWNVLYALPCAPSRSSGYRAPLYFAVRDLEELWIAMHLHDWRVLLADLRVRLYAGEEAIARMGLDLKSELMVPWPRMGITLDGRLWPAGVTLETIIHEFARAQNSRLAEYQRIGEEHYASLPTPAIAARLSSAKQLRILGITSRYTTVLQYSMRDWLASFAAMGHETKLLIEQHDHELPTNLVHAKASAEFRPDLVLIIDHYRAELSGIPKGVPCVMWIQDRMPSIFCAAAGAAQGERDYTIGYGKIECIQHHGYPADRFMPCTMAVNTARFAPSPPPSRDPVGFAVRTNEVNGSHSEPYGKEFACDVAFVSHATLPAETILKKQLEANPSEAAQRLLDDIFQRMQAVYEAGGALTHALQVQAIIDQSMLDTGLRLASAHMPAMRELFVQQINNALYRHQSLGWVAEMGVDLRLYGRGWESHPQFGRFARGVADNQQDLCSIFQASRLNLQLTPLGAMHQRLLEGLAAGGFFLLRWHPADVVGQIYPDLYRWCQRNDVQDQQQFLERMDDQARAEMHRVRQLLGFNPLAGEEDFVQWLGFYEQIEYASCASSVFGNHYDAIAFNSRQDLQQKVARFLGNAEERRQIARDMRSAVLERFSYEAISRRLLEFITTGLKKSSFPSQTTEAAA